MFFTIVFLASVISLVQAAPHLVPRQPAVPASKIATLAPYTQFARASYCGTSAIENWSCGEACDAIPSFTPTLVGGDGNAVQIFFVGYWREQNSVVVAHEGTDPTKFLSLLTDADIIMSPLDSALFPRIPSTVLVHDGFRKAQAKTASSILKEVKRLMSSQNTNSLTLIGHSLGGAIVELDSLFFALNLPGVTIKAITYGTPRVGNREFAQLLDKRVPDLTRVNNKKDMIPILPGRFLGYSHPAGEIHILSGENAVACTGDDSAVGPKCTDSMVRNIFEGNILDHLGPYDGISVGTIFCY